MLRSLLLVFALIAALGLAATFFVLRRDDRVQSASAPEAVAPTNSHADASNPNKPEARVAVGAKRPNVPRPTAEAAAEPEGGEDGGVHSRDVEFSARYAGRTPAQLDADYTALAERVSAERERLLRARFDSGVYDASVISPDDLPLYERRIAKLENESDKVCTTRCVRPDAASGGSTDGPVEFQSTCLSRADAPELFDSIEELRWLEARIDRGADETGDEPDHH